jgi:hypothetical protein
MIMDMGKNVCLRKKLAKGLQDLFPPPHVDQPVMDDGNVHDRARYCFRSSITRDVSPCTVCSDQGQIIIQGTEARPYFLSASRTCGSTAQNINTQKK